jgi:hypothetical protein
MGAGEAPRRSGVLEAREGVQSGRTRLAGPIMWLRAGYTGAYSGVQ